MSINLLNFRNLLYPHLLLIYTSLGWMLLVRKYSLTNFSLNPYDRAQSIHGFDDDDDELVSSNNESKTRLACVCISSIERDNDDDEDGDAESLLSSSLPVPVLLPPPNLIDPRSKLIYPGRPNAAIPNPIRGNTNDDTNMMNDEFTVYLCDVLLSLGIFRFFLFVCCCMRGACTAFARAQPPWDTFIFRWKLGVVSLQVRTCVEF